MKIYDHHHPDGMVPTSRRHPELEAMILTQATAYQDATVRFGRGKEENSVAPALVPGQYDQLGWWGVGNYGTAVVMSYYAPIMKMAGGNRSGKSGWDRRRAQRELEDAWQVDLEHQAAEYHARLEQEESWD